MPKQDLNRELTTVKKAQEKKAREQAKEDEEQKQKRQGCCRGRGSQAHLTHEMQRSLFGRLESFWSWADRNGLRCERLRVSTAQERREHLFSDPMIVSTFPQMQTDFKNVFEKWEGYFTKHCAKHNITKAVCDAEKKHGLGNSILRCKSSSPSRTW